MSDCPIFADDVLVVASGAKSSSKAWIKECQSASSAAAGNDPMLDAQVLPDFDVGKKTDSGKANMGKRWKKWQVCWLLTVLATP